MEREEKKKKRNPPYLPVSLLDQFFQKIRTVNVPDFIDVKTLRTWGIATKQEYFLISALGFLGLIDEELKPTSEFAKIQIEGNQFKTNLKEIVEKAYSDVFKAYKIEHLTSEDLINFFGQNYSQRSKYRMVKPFAYLCKLAGIESPAFKDIETKRKKDISKPKPSDLPKPRTRTPKGQITSPENDRVLQLAQIMADWDAEKMKVFFENIDKIKEEKVKQENEKTEG